MKELEQSKKLLAIDADIPCYSIAYGCKDTRDEDIVHKRVDDFFAKLFATHNTFNYKAFLTGKGNFRKATAVSHVYKDKRPPKPYWHKSIRDYIVHEWSAEVVQGMEADDKLAMELTENTILYLDNAFIITETV